MIRTALAVSFLLALYACAGTRDYIAYDEMGIPSFRIRF